MTTAYATALTSYSGTLASPPESLGTIATTPRYTLQLDRHRVVRIRPRIEQSHGRFRTAMLITARDATDRHPSRRPRPPASAASPGQGGGELRAWTRRSADVCGGPA